MQYLINKVQNFACIVIAAGIGLVMPGCREKAVEDTPNACMAVVCNNGGSCSQGKCICPAGYEGDQCDIAWVDRYLGTWSVTETIVRSSVDSLEGKTNSFSWQISGSERAVVFLINNMKDVDSYDGIEGRMGLSADNQFTDAHSYQLLPKSFENGPGNKFNVDGGAGQLNNARTLMFGQYYTTTVTNGVPVYDTISFEALYSR